MKPATDNMAEGPTAFSAFKNAMRKIVAVPHSVIAEREAAYQKQAKANPNRRGPKPSDDLDSEVAMMREKRGKAR